MTNPFFRSAGEQPECTGQARNQVPRHVGAVVALLSAAIFLVAPRVSAQIPRGVFSLSTSGKPCSDTVLANTDVVGVSIRYPWFDLEPVEGDFDWTFLDDEVARVAAAGKQVLLRIGTMSGRPEWVTTAVRRAGGKFFTFDDNGVTTSIPVFWDPTFLAKKKAMIAALGKHFTKNPAVVIITASFANATSEDWNVPHTATDITNWFAVGYTTAKLLDAGKQIIDATMAAFPNQYVTLAIGGNGHTGATGNLDPTADYVAENAIATARTSWPGRLIAQINSLSTFNPEAPGPDGSIWNLLWNSRPDVGAQMVYWCFDDPTYRVNGGEPGKPSKVLTECVDAAVSYELNYIEIYQKDVINLPSVIDYAKTQLDP
jgi:glycosyl hydrolase family 42 (putative beta-galactosidase)